MARFKLAKSGRRGDLSAGSGADAGQTLRWCRDVVSRVRALDPDMESRTDASLRALTGLFRARLARGEPLDDLLPDAFAAVREAAARTLGQRHFDVQLMGGAVLHRGAIAEMETGEGKTLTATLTAYLNALPGTGMHVMTANDYLAARDAAWMQPVYEFLGLTTGLLDAGPDLEFAARRRAYAADVTYGAWDDFLCDYLRDNLAWDTSDLAQRGYHFALADEADLILLDEMRTAPGISGPADPGESRHAELARLADSLRRGTDYEADERGRTLSLTPAGTQHAEQRLRLGDASAAERKLVLEQLRSALRAKEFYQRDRDYAIADGAIAIIDKSSGRVRRDRRRYGEGIHEAIEAREGLPVGPVTQSLLSVPVWDYLAQYERLAGMTATAMTEAEVYRQVYDLDVVVIPTNKPVIRTDHPDMLYPGRQAKLAAVADDCAARQAAGQPVLIGTASAADAAEVSGLLAERGVGHSVLTARDHQREGPLMASAGEPGAVTVIARMAGRGVDIVLGGPDGARRDEVADRGGLCVLGVERPGSRRLEMHLRGRAGRQGDPGESTFYVSFEDDMVTRMLGTKLASGMARTYRDARHFARLSRDLGMAQVRTAKNAAAWYVQMVGYDSVLAGQRHAYFAARGPAVAGQDLRAWTRSTIEEVAGAEGAAEALAAHDRREAELSPPVMRELERRMMLSVRDRAWRQHAPAVEELLKTMSARSPDVVPLAEYRREAGRLCTAMDAAVKRDIVDGVLHMEITMDETR